MIASILIAVSAGLTLVIQSIALARCHALKCVRETPDVEPPEDKNKRPRIELVNANNYYDDTELL